MQRRGRPKPEEGNGLLHLCRAKNPKYKLRRRSRGSSRWFPRLAKYELGRRGGSENWRLPPRFWRKNPNLKARAVAPLEQAVSWLHRVFLQVLELSGHGAIRFQVLQQLKVRPLQAVFLGQQAENHNDADHVAVQL